MRFLRPSSHYRVIFPSQLFQDEPIYHLPLVGTPPHQTQCGRMIGVHRPLLPTKHVRKFAKPCKGCFPGGIDA